ncbi:MAG: DUF1559 domain-containing protein [Phycisphaerales bacterium]|jgi:prepilin-type N-terminal cleavage/methylation domain-containing protein/prepilin-type processing-associated H-X9-DG protein
MRRRGFTLIELLVVVALVSLLVTLSVEGLRIVRGQARAVACAANIRQLSTGLFAYEASYDRFPPGYEIPDPRIGGRNAGSAGFLDAGGWWWFDRIQKMNHLTRDGYKGLACPSKRQGHPWLDADILVGNYGANFSVFRSWQYMNFYKPFYGLPLSLQQIPRPSQTLLLADSGYSLITWWHVADEPPVEFPTFNSNAEVIPLGTAQHAAYVPGMSLNRDKALCLGQAEDAIGGRHPHKTVNVAMADGSVGIRRPADSLSVERTGDDQWSNSPLWQPKPDASVTPTITSTSPTP